MSVVVGERVGCMEIKRGYALDNAWAEARRRLALLEEVFDPTTIGAFEDLGVGSGWRCLEVGAGGGSITRWLCDRVGPTGRVTAVDLDTRFIEPDAPANLEIHQCDVTTAGIPGDGYDLIHTRATLMHIPGDRDRIVEELVGKLAPGGWILTEEGDTDLALRTDSEVLRELWTISLAVLARAGMDQSYGRRLPDLLLQAGLEDVQAQTLVQWFRGGSPLAQFITLTLDQLAPALAAAGDPDHAKSIIEGARTELSDPALIFPGFGVVTTRARRPS